MSAELLFTPDEYRKGNATREPCDLAWASRDMLVLMCMQKSKRPQSKQDEHNFEQLRGWLRTWQTTEHRLTGRTELKEFNYDWHELPLVVLSVTDASDSSARIISLPGFPKNEAESKVLLACSLPSSSLILLGEYGGSALDLATLIRRLSHQGGYASEATFNSWITGTRDEALRRLFMVRPVEHESFNDLLDTYGHQTLLQLRQGDYDHNAETLPADSDATSSIFNDVDWFHLFDTVWLIEHTSRTVASVPWGALGPAAIGTVKKIGPYTIFISAFEGASSSSRDKVMTGYASTPSRTGYPTIGLFTLLFNRSREDEVRFMMVVGPSPIGPSRTLSLYEETAKREAQGHNDPDRP